MPKPTDVKRGPGRPRKGLVKVTLSLLPEQLAALRIYALSRRVFAPTGPVRPDLSEAVRGLLMEPAVTAALRGAFDAYRAKLDELHASPEGGADGLAARLVSGVLDRSFDVLGSWPLGAAAEDGARAASPRRRKR
jgi:hypothetical protein